MKMFLTAALLLLSPLTSHAQTLETFPHVEGVSYYYFLCNATSWNLDEKSRLKCDDAQCISMFLDYQVEADWMVSSQDSCELLKTPILDQRNEDSEKIGAYVERPNEEAKVGFMKVPAVARFYGHGSFQVQYEAKGPHRIWLTRARDAFSIQALPQK